MFENNILLCRLILRRDRVRLAIWFVGMMLLAVGLGAVLPNMYPTEQERLIMAETMKSPAMVAMIGPIYDENGFSVGALYNTMMTLWTAAIMGIMNIMLVVRHTRQDEERGRIEVIRSLPVGRLSNLSAVLTVSVLANIVFSIFIVTGLTSLGVESMDFAGSLLFGVVVGVTGIVFATVTAVFCQLTANPRTAQSLSFGFLIISYIVRGAGDIQSELLACISPLGLILRAKVYIENQWHPVFILLAVSAVFAAIAFLLCGMRDMGEGFLPAKPGKREAAPYLGSAEGLVWRLIKTPFFVWLFVMVLLGIAYGSIMGDLESFLSTNELFRQMFPDGDPSKFISFLMVIMSICGTIPVLQFILKARSQEKSGYAENILARAVSRYGQLRGYFIIAFAAGLLVPFATALGFWLGSTPVMENPIAFTMFLRASMIYVPALWFMIGVAMVLIAYLPRYTSLVWAFLGYAFFVLYIGSVINLPDWMGKLSPFGFIPKIPAEEMNIPAIAVMLIIDAAMFVVGFIGYGKRDMKFD